MTGAKTNDAIISIIVIKIITKTWSGGVRCWGKPLDSHSRRIFPQWRILTPAHYTSSITLCNGLLLCDTINVTIVTFHLFWWHLFQKICPAHTRIHFKRKGLHMRIEFEDQRVNIKLSGTGSRICIRNRIKVQDHQCPSSVEWHQWWGLRSSGIQSLLKVCWSHCCSFCSNHTFCALCIVPLWTTCQWLLPFLSPTVSS